MKLYRGAWYIQSVSGLKLDATEKSPSCSESLTIAFSTEKEIVTDDTIRKLLTK